jgi:AraC-like DNA-binding protein
MMISSKRTSTNPILKQYIHSYTYSIGKLYDNEAKFLTRAFPSIMTQLIFEFYGETNEILIDKQKHKIEKGTYVKCGLSHWVDIYRLPHNREYRKEKFFQVILYPHALFEIFNISPVELMDSMDIKIEDIFGKTQTSLLYEELESLECGEKMIEVFERYFLNFVLNVEKKNLKCFTPSLFEGLKFQKIQDCSKELNYSTRWLQKRYKETLGASFKSIQSNIRFLASLERIYKLFFSGQKIHLTSIAYEFGYYDQSHFSKEFERYSGMSPSEFLNFLSGDRTKYQTYLTDLHSSISQRNMKASGSEFNTIQVDLNLDIY